MDIIVIAVLALPAAAVYTAPVLLAHARRLPASPRLIAVNLLLGWTIAGWAVALSMAARANTRPARPPGPGRADPPHLHTTTELPAWHSQRPGQAPRPAPSGPAAAGPPEPRVISVKHSLN